MPLVAHQSLYTISVFIKDLLIWILPITVGLFIAHTICTFHHKAPLFIGSLIIFEALSNFTSVWYAFAGGYIAADYLPAIKLPAMSIEFSTLWRLPLIKPAWWSVNKGTLLGLLLGCFTLVSKKASLTIQAIDHSKERELNGCSPHIFSRLHPAFCPRVCCSYASNTGASTDICPLWAAAGLAAAIFIPISFSLILGRVQLFIQRSSKKYKKSAARWRDSPSLRVAVYPQCPGRLQELLKT